MSLVVHAQTNLHDIHTALIIMIAIMISPVGIKFKDCGRWLDKILYAARHDKKRYSFWQKKP